MKVAVVNWCLRDIRTLTEYQDHARELCSKCDGAELIVLPENVSLELLHLLDWDESNACQQLAHNSRWHLDVIKSLVLEFNASIVGGTYFVQKGDAVLNVCPIIRPVSDSVIFQTKNKLTQYEMNEWGLSAGSGVSVEAKPVGVAICYDSEFPECGRAHAEAGIQVLCVPTYTETEHGYHRVSLSCRARAIENQYFVLMSSLVGSLGREPVVSTYGRSAIYAPCIEQFPADGILAQTGTGEGVAIADLDLSVLESAHQAGDVRNWADRLPDCWSACSSWQLS